MNIKLRPSLVIIKTISLFVLVNVIYGLIAPPVAGISVYNMFFPGRKRMPFGSSSNPASVTIDNLNAMFASHEISAAKKPNEIRVALVGDSSIWGDALSVHDTLSEQWNQQQLQCHGKTVKFYNLGYPHPSIIKDLLFLDALKDKQPDLIVWFATLNTLMNQYRVNPFIIENRELTLKLLNQYDIPFGPGKALSEQQESFYQRTLIGQRSFLARWLKLQALGVNWTATGDDVGVIRPITEMILNDVKKDSEYRGLEPGTDLNDFLLLDALSAGFDIAGETPVLLVNEPIYVASGLHSEVRYNELYPHWAYDQYRNMIAARAKDSSWNYLDLWNAIPPEKFSNSPLHLTAMGEHLFLEQINPSLLGMICK